MPLIKCPACLKDVSDQAVSCPNCGHPFKSAAEISYSAAPKTTNAGKSAQGIGCLVLLLLVGGCFLYVNSEANKDKEAEEAHPTCKSNWTLCTDNADMVVNNSNWTTAEVLCKETASDRAQYGSPKWPWVPFSTYLKGKDYVSSGIATLIESDAQFSNAFGGMVHSQVICKYDLRAKKVLDVNIIPR
jgi:hypothetical protein